MTILDANILIYAWNMADPSHKRAREWIENLLSSEELVGIPWTSAWAFVRITTNHRLMKQPLTTDRALDVVQRWFGLPNVTIPEPGSRHIDLVRTLSREAQAGGSLFSDAVLAALAVENAAVLASTDQDFSRFRQLNWINPLSA